MTCAVCGAALREDIAYCHVCGARTAPEGQPVEQAKVLLGTAAEIRRLGNLEGELRTYDLVVERFTESAPALAAEALLRKAATLAEMGRQGLAITTYAGVQERFSNSADPSVAGVLQQACWRRQELERVGVEASRLTRRARRYFVRSQEAYALLTFSAAVVLGASAVAELAFGDLREAATLLLLAAGAGCYAWVSYKQQG